jgi:hypothetical protein
LIGSAIQRRIAGSALRRPLAPRVPVADAGDVDRSRPLPLRAAAAFLLTVAVGVVLAGFLEGVALFVSIVIVLLVGGTLTRRATARAGGREVLKRPAVPRACGPRTRSVVYPARPSSPMPEGSADAWEVCDRSEPTRCRE